MNWEKYRDVNLPTRDERTARYLGSYVGSSGKTFLVFTIRNGRFEELTTRLDSGRVNSNSTHPGDILPPPRKVFCNEYRDGSMSAHEDAAVAEDKAIEGRCLRVAVPYWIEECTDNDD